MSPPASRRLRDLFLQATEIEDAGARAAFLDQACGGDVLLRRRLEELLAADLVAGPAPATTGPTLADFLTASLTEQPGDTIGKYKLREKLGEGGCGVVYLAEQEEPVRRRVAIKIIKLGMDTRQVVARFEAERQALALMDHPNIAKILEAGATETGRPYFVMELVGGIKITDYCEQNNQTTRQRLGLFIQVCRAVQHAHQKGIIHRDIKPSNVLVATQDGVPVPKVIDFGIAKATEGKLSDQTVFTAFEQFLGTPAYMSPEQAQLSGLDVDTRSDIYSLGVLLYELLTGKTPFDTKELLAAGLDAMRRTIQEKEPPTPSTRLKQDLAAQQPQSSGSSKIMNRKSKIENDLDWIVMKCLEKDRARRYETANGLAMDIQRHLINEPVDARPPSSLYRLQKTVRRHRAAFATAAAVGTALLICVVVSTSEAVRAERSEEEQIRLRKQAESVSELFFLAQEFNSQKRWKESEATYRRALSIGRELYGNNHLQIAFTLCHLASTLEKQDRPSEAEPFYREALALATRLLKSKNPQIVSMLLDRTYRLSVIDLLDQLATALEKQGKTLELEMSYRQTLTELSPTLGEHQPARGVILNDFGSRLLRMGKVAEAEKMYRQALDVQRQSPVGTDLDYRLLSLRELSDILQRQGKIAEAENLRREAQGLTVGHLGTNK